MRLSFTSKPISSPGRTDKFPPPLMRFLRSNVGSRSRGRTRATPLFMRRKKTLSSSSAIETTQEPSSPKVTCIGQVRVRRSKSSSSSKNPTKKPTNNTSNKYNCCCYCFKKPSFCKMNMCKPKFPKWVCFFNCRSVKVRTDSSKFSSKFGEQDEQQREGVVHEGDERERRISISFDMPTSTTTTTTTATTPPKNALLLTRCRSAPYRSSSLACQFWGSPSAADDKEECEGEGEDEEDEEGAQNTEEEEENRALGNEQSSRDSTAESRGDPDSECSRRSLKKDIGVCAQVAAAAAAAEAAEEEDKKSATCSNEKGDAVNGDNDGGGGSRPPLMVLMRCKSEPARRDSEKLDPQSCEFWRHRRLGNTESSTPHSHAAD